jgi:hypothetical protein
MLLLDDDIQFRLYRITDYSRYLEVNVRALDIGRGNGCGVKMGIC